MKTKFHEKYFKDLEKKKEDDSFTKFDIFTICFLLFIILLCNLPLLLGGLVGWLFNDKTLFESTLGRIEVIGDN